MAVIYQQRGEYKEAVKAYELALDIGKSIGSKNIQAMYLGNLAALFGFQGQRDRELLLHHEVLELSKTMGYNVGQVLSLMNIGTWHLEHGKYEAATSQYDQALEIARLHNLKGHIPMIKLNEGLILHYQNKLFDAKTRLESAIELALEIKSKPIEDYARRYLGFVLLDMNNIEEAKNQFNLAKTIAESMGSKVSLASSSIGLGTINLMNNGDRKLLNQGIEGARNIGDNEVLLKGLICLVRQLKGEPANENEVKNLLKEASEVAKKGGYLCDLPIIEELST